jgi:hypothetical protein
VNDDASTPIYAVIAIDRRCRRQLVAEYREPAQAKRHAQGLCWAGTPATVMLMTELEQTSQVDFAGG